MKKIILRILTSDIFIYSTIAVINITVAVVVGCLIYQEQIK